MAGLARGGEHEDWAVGLNQLAGLVTLLAGWPDGGDEEGRQGRVDALDVTPIVRVSSERAVLGIQLRH